MSNAVNHKGYSDIAADLHNSHWLFIDSVRNGTKLDLDMGVQLTTSIIQKESVKLYFAPTTGTGTTCRLVLP